MTMVDTVAALTRPLVERLSNRLGGPVWNRRNFLVRTALFGSAVAIAPKEFALEPRTAYQSVCGLSTKCHDGYTAFCCTINNGANFCPTGTFIAGWWKADRASFCGGKARYYVDCNGLPHTEWHCHCPSTTTCDKRHVSCVQFRYGNCHTEIAIDVRKSPVVCRLVTCTPPWQFDPSCTKASFTDQETVTHSAPCLPGPNPSAITNKWSDLGGKGGELGPAIGSVQATALLSGTWQRYARGAVFQVQGLGVHGVRPRVWNRFGTTIATGKWGYPTEDGHPSTDNVGWRQVFQSKTGTKFSPSAVVTVHPSFGTFAVLAPAIGPWSAAGAESRLGYPIATTTPTPGGYGTYTPCSRATSKSQRVLSAVVTSTTLGGYVINDAMFSAWTTAGGINGPGYPLGNASPTAGGIGTTQRFVPIAAGVADYEQTSTYVSSAAGTFSLLGPIATAWAFDQSLGGSVGLPATSPTSAVSGSTSYSELICTKGRLYASTLCPASSLTGALLDAYLSAGGPLGSLGLPLTSTVLDGLDVSHVTFERGTLTLTGTVVVTS